MKIGEQFKKTQESLEKADALARIRKSAMFVTEESKGANETPEKILYDASAKTPGEMLATYAAKYAKYATMPLDVDGEKVRFYRGQWSIFSGYTGTGKTTHLRQMVCHWLRAGETVFVATLESDPEDYVIEVACTAAGVEMVNEAQLTAFLAQYGDKLKVWGVIGIAEHKKILATIRDLADKGVTYAIIDSLMVLDVDTGDFEAQRQFAALLNATVLAKQIHIVLVAHPKKPMSADQEPSTNDVSGSAQLGNLCWNMFFIRRGEQGPDNGITAMILIVLKQRKRGWVGELLGCYYREHNQFHLDASATGPVRYLYAEGVYPATGLTEDIPAHLMNRNSFRVDRADTTTPPWQI